MDIDSILCKVQHEFSLTN